MKQFICACVLLIAAIGHAETPQNSSDNKAEPQSKIHAVIDDKIPSITQEDKPAFSEAFEKASQKYADSREYAADVKLFGQDKTDAVLEQVKADAADGIDKLTKLAYDDIIYYCTARFYENAKTPYAAIYFQVLGKMNGYPGLSNTVKLEFLNQTSTMVKLMTGCDDERAILQKQFEQGKIKADYYGTAHLVTINRYLEEQIIWHSEQQYETGPYKDSKGHPREGVHATISESTIAEGRQVELEIKSKDYVCKNVVADFDGMNSGDQLCMTPTQWKIAIEGEGGAGSTSNPFNDPKFVQ